MSLKAWGHKLTHISRTTGLSATLFEGLMHQFDARPRSNSDSSTSGLRAHWRFREALDPGQDGGSPIALPPDPILVSDLTALTWELTPHGIKITPKKDLVKRLGRSPDRGDAVVMSWFDGARAATHIQEWRPDQRVGGPSYKRHPQVNFGPRYRRIGSSSMSSSPRVVLRRPR